MNFTPPTPPVDVLICYPHFDTKHTHFQEPDVLELPPHLVAELAYGAPIQVHVPAEQMLIEPF